MTVEYRQPDYRYLWIGLPIALVAIAATALQNQKVVDRLETVRRELAEAGYPEARVDRFQAPKEMRRCDVSQIKKPGFAYAWKTGTHSGLFCHRLDGRPNEIILD